MKFLKKLESMGACFHSEATGKLMLRLTLGLLMLPHGIAKIGNLGFINMELAKIGIPSFVSYGVLIGEIVAPLMLILGFRARLGALIMAFNMVVAILLVHAKDIFAFGDRGELALELQYFFLFTSIVVLFLGAGKWAISTKSKWD